MLDTATARDVQARVGALTTRPQLIEANDKVKFGTNGIVNIDTARTYLEGSQWIAVGATFTRTELFSVLMKVALLPQATLKTMAHTLRALAFMGEEIGDTLTDEIAGAGAAMSPMVDGMVAGQNTLQTTMIELKSESAVAMKAAEEAREGMCNLEAQVQELMTMVEEAGVAAATAAAERAATKVTPTGPRSYAATAVAAAPMTAEQAWILSRGIRMRRQILVDKARDATNDSLGALSELELKEKAALALTIMESKLEGAAIVGAKKLPNGGVVFDCIDEKTATWVKGHDVMAQLISALGGTCVYRRRRTELIAEMVPVDARIDDGGTWRTVEREGGFAEGSIVGAKWVKAVERRTVGQRVAHLRVEFADADAANHAIDHGFYLLGQHVRVRKSEEEVRRCLKCQKFDGHLANACKSDVDVCGRCAETHRTADCDVTDSGTFKCANCHVEGMVQQAEIIRCSIASSRDAKPETPL
ncbi:hypothetical protein B0H19DRAFT_1265324 [Mycena capillaripes]|nr:hypothetical protein B0H19DRAFT_1265324 [Mycena capillaripes]